MLNHLFGYEAKRKRLLKKAPPGALKEYLSIPFPCRDIAIDEAPILSVDFETTGLNPHQDQILSIGHIGINNSEIHLASAYHKVIRTKGALGEENVIIHQIMDDTRSQGDTMKAAIEELLHALAGKVMLVHFANIEKNFLDAACKQLFGMAPVFPIIDTLMLAKRRLDRHSTAYDPSELRLFNLKETYNLPRYGAHNALSDALSTAELFLAEVAEMNEQRSPPLKSVLL